MDIEIPNLTNEMLEALRDQPTIVSVVRENETHLLIRAKGEDAFDDIIDTIRARNGKIAFVKSLEPSLEDVFLHITGREMRAEVSSKVRSFQGGGRHGPPALSRRVR